MLSSTFSGGRGKRHAFSLTPRSSPRLSPFCLLSWICQFLVSVPVFPLLGSVSGAFVGQLQEYAAFALLLRSPFLVVHLSVYVRVRSLCFPVVGSSFRFFSLLRLARPLPRNETKKKERKGSDENQNKKG